MNTPEKPFNENERLEELYKYQILDTPYEKEFDELVQLASQICDIPISLITLVDKERQWFKASVGVDVRETPRDVSFCAHAIHDDKALIIRDALEDERFVNNPLVQDQPNIRFYAGVPLISPKGYRMGTLCVIDTRPRDLSDEQINALEVLSRQVSKQMDLMLANNRLAESLEKVEQQNHELEKLNRTNNKLLSVISHDLRSPFTTMSGFLDLIEQDALSGEEILSSTKGLKNLLVSSTDLLENLIQWGISRISSDELDLQSVNLFKVTNEIFADLKPVANKKGNELENLIPDNMELEVDSVMLRFIIRNLTQNAIKFTENGNISVSADEYPEYHRISVRDNGRGMIPEHQSGLFNWEKRLSTKGTSGEKGSGLGLLLCKDFVENHKGEIKVKSKAGEGTEFSFTISKKL